MQLEAGRVFNDFIYRSGSIFYRWLGGVSFLYFENLDAEGFTLTKKMAAGLPQPSISMEGEGGGGYNETSK